MQAVERHCSPCVEGRSVLQGAAVRPGRSESPVESLDHVHQLPFTTKADLQAAYPYGMFAVPMSEVVRIHSSSGTKGQPTVVGCARNDLAVEVKEDLYSGWREQMQPLAAKIGRRLGEILGLTARVTIVAPGSLPRTEGKAQHVADRSGD